MKKVFSLVSICFFASIILFQMGSCKPAYTKTDTVSKHNPSITGLWAGTYTVDGNPIAGQQYFSITIKPDKTITSDTKGGNRQHLGVGYWTLNGDTLICISICVYGFPENIGIVERYTALFNQTSGTLSSGIWQNYPNPTGTGTFRVTRIK